jgi:hypothetical protein
VEAIGGVRRGLVILIVWVGILAAVVIATRR